MTSVDYNNVNIREEPLHTPPLAEVADVLRRALPSTFEYVSAEVVQCPDLTQEPFGLTSPGLCGDPVLVELGGPPYLLPTVNRDKVYDLAALVRHTRRDPALLVGAGAGPWPHYGVNCEGVINLSIREGAVVQGSRAVTVEPRGAAKGSSGYQLHRVPPHETRSALLGNYLLSDGAPGEVIKVVAKKRVGESNFVTAVREALRDHYGDRVVGAGGVVLLREGRAKHHVMPDFPSAPITTDQQVEDWLHFFEIDAPILHLGTLVTGDLGLDLRVQHFHGWGGAAGGHYHCDTSAARAHYEAYLLPARRLLRLDAPAHTHRVGRD